ncbi:MAG TPA: hypothetical protein VK563_23775 [Puia sp.]|nr:hypothetical protein [Puia sp.]
MPKTGFRPQTDGYDFNNTWNTDANYKDFLISSIRSQLVPVLAKAFASNPALAPLFGALGLVASNLLELLGSVFGIPPGLGISTGIAAGAATEYITNQLNGIVDRSAPEHYGACGGMAFSSLDYYFADLVIPKGTQTQQIDGQLYSVPDGIGPESKTLRNYIFQRLQDSYGENHPDGVFYRTLEWYLILKTIPAQFNGGGAALKEKTKSEWVLLAASIDRGKPLALGLVADELNIFESHQVVAYGYDGDPWAGTGLIFIYDNKHPNQECELHVDLKGNELNMKMLLHNGTEADDPGHVINYKGFFCSAYTASMPPPSLGARNLMVSPGSCLSIGEPFRFHFDVCTTGFIGNGPTLKISPVIHTGPEEMIIPGPPYLYIDVWSDPAAAGHPFADVTLHNSLSFSEEGKKKAHASVYIAPFTGNEIQRDNDNALLVRLKKLAGAGDRQADVTADAFIPVNVLKRVTVSCVEREKDDGDFAFIPGAACSFQADNFFGTEPVNYHWLINGILQKFSNSRQFRIYSLPLAGASLDITVKIVAENTGCMATGNFHLTVLTPEEASRFRLICHLRREIGEMGIYTQLLDPSVPLESVAQYLDLQALTKLQHGLNALADTVNSANPQHFKDNGF